MALGYGIGLWHRAMTLPTAVLQRVHFPISSQETVRGLPTLQWLWELLGPGRTRDKQGSAPHSGEKAANIWQISDKYLTNIWQISDKYLANIWLASLLVPPHIVDRLQKSCNIWQASFWTLITRSSGAVKFLVDFWRSGREKLLRSTSL